MSPAELLAAARSLMEQPDPASAGAWPRACALLTRQALEVALDQLWSSGTSTNELVRCSMRTQLLCAPSYLDPAVAARMTWTWAALTRACHHHAYELAPTALELDRWMTAVGELVDRMDRPAALAP